MHPNSPPTVEQYPSFSPNHTQSDQSPDELEWEDDSEPEDVHVESTRKRETPGNASSQPSDHGPDALTPNLTPFQTLSPSMYGTHPVSAPPTGAVKTVGRAVRPPDTPAPPYNFSTEAVDYFSSAVAGTPFTFRQKGFADAIHQRDESQLVSSPDIIDSTAERPSSAGVLDRRMEGDFSSGGNFRTPKQHKGKGEVIPGKVGKRGWRLRGTTSEPKRGGTAQRPSSYSGSSVEISSTVDSEGNFTSTSHLNSIATMDRDYKGKGKGRATDYPKHNLRRYFSDSPTKQPSINSAPNQATPPFTQGKTFRYYDENPDGKKEESNQLTLPLVSAGWHNIRSKLKRSVPSKSANSDRRTHSYWGASDLSSRKHSGNTSANDAHVEERVRNPAVVSRWRAASAKARLMASLLSTKGKQRDHLRGARIEGLLFPFFGSFLAVPGYAFQRDGKDRKGPAILFEALKLAITDSESDKAISRVTFRVELEYGDIRWIIHRTLYDFVRLHSVLSIKHFQGLLPPIPNLPSTVVYAVGKMRDLQAPPESRVERRERASLDRRIALEKYLLKLLKAMNLRVCYELFAFLEISAMSIQPHTGYKGKEGLLHNKVGVRIFCRLFEKRQWKPRWVMVRDSFVAIGRNISARHPDVVLFCDRFFSVLHTHQHHNPIRRHRIQILNRNQSLEFACDSERLLLDWKEHFERLQESAWSKEQRWGSFAPVRKNSFVKWFVDGEDYFWAVSEALLAAKRTIYIEDWWLSPELYLRRPPSKNREFRIDRILRKKAKEGVQVRVFIYKEVTYALPLSSKYTKLALQRGLHPNIIVQRHPDHMPGGIMFWAHHEKMIIVDQEVAFVGGIDLCYGRYDNRAHRLADNYSNAPIQETWPGQDYSNPRIKDFKDVFHFDMELIDRRLLPRMPWHDVNLGMVGQPARDVARHFIQRWNFVGKSELILPASDFIGMPTSKVADTLLNPSKRYTASGPPHVVKTELEESEADFSENEPEESEEVGKLDTNSEYSIADVEDPQTLVQPTTPLPQLPPRKKRSSTKSERSVSPLPGPQSAPPPSSSKTPTPSVPGGTCTVQVLRQSAEWSLGIDNEQSVYNAYIELITTAEHFVYIENQFFVTSTGEVNSPIKNLIGKAIVNRIRRAHEEQTKFRVVVVMPLLPAFESELSAKDASTVRLVVQYQYSSISRGPNSVIETLKSWGINPSDYIGFFGLRKYDTISTKSQPDDEDGELRQTNVLSIHDAQDANTNVNSTEAGDETELAEGRERAEVRRAYGGISSQSDFRDNGMEDVDEEDDNSEVRNAIDINHDENMDEMDSNSDIRSDRRVRVKTRTKNSGLTAERILPAEPAEPTVQPPLSNAERSVLDEGRAVVTEQVYVHSKVLIVDDRIVICGSANLNDRSMCGNRDSEICLCVEDRERIPTRMGGKEYMAARFAHTLRTYLYREHLGTLPDEKEVLSKEEEITRDAAVEDPLADEFYNNVWKSTASTNTAAFREVFHCVPDDQVTTWEEYKDFRPDTNTVVTGHTVLRNETVDAILERLKGVRGHLVEFPTEFLKGEVLDASLLSKESLAPAEIFT